MDKLNHPVYTGAADSSGHLCLDVSPGDYTLNIQARGFMDTNQAETVKATPQHLEVTLSIGSNVRSDCMSCPDPSIPDPEQPKLTMLIIGGATPMVLPKLKKHHPFSHL